VTDTSTRTPQKPLAERLFNIANELALLAKPGGQGMTKKEVDAMWTRPDHHGSKASDRAPDLQL
jgi:hypothetical protein